MTFTDAEARIYEELGSIIRGEFVVTNIARTDFHDIFYYEDSDSWYKCKISYESQDADSEKQKKISQNFLVNSRSVKEAFESLQESLKTLRVDFDIPSIMISPIVDIFPYSENLDKEISRTPLADFDEPVVSSGKPVFSASGSDVDDEEFEDEEADSELEDEFTEED